MIYPPDIQHVPYMRNVGGIRVSPSQAQQAYLLACDVAEEARNKYPECPSPEYDPTCQQLKVIVETFDMDFSPKVGTIGRRVSLQTATLRVETQLILMSVGAEKL